MVRAFIIVDIFIEILVHFGVYLFACWHQLYYKMNVFIIMNISNSQHRMYYDNYSMNVFNIVTVLMGQLGTSCVFDSPGLARNEPTPGEYSQGDSTP